MADFRRWFYALAVVALFTLPAFAQQVPFTCNTNAGVPPIVRTESYADLVGDLTLSCTGGTPTTPGQSVPQVNITIFLSTNITSKLLGSSSFNPPFDEALLIVDEPNAAGPNSNRPILNCGAQGTADTGPSGPGVCSIIAPATGPSNTYDGTVGNGTYGSGRPNVFQGRLFQTCQLGQNCNIVTFLGVPLDPPGTGTTRTLRITNVRADAEYIGVTTTFQQLPITMQISVNGNTSLLINNPIQTVAYVQKGLTASVVNPRLDFAQCNDENGGLFGGGSGTINQYFNTPQPALRFKEGFASSWKEKNIAQHLANSTYGGAGYTYTVGSTMYPSDLNQNVPGAIYNTESGFEYQPPPIGNPSPNPPPGIGNGTVTGYLTGYPFASSTGTGIAGAGVASQGTRLAVKFQPGSIPQGSGVWTPQVVYLVRQNSPGTITGVAVLTSTDSAGDSAYNGSASTTLVQVSNNLAVFEVLYDDPFSLEQVDVPLVIAYHFDPTQNLPIGLPQTGQPAMATGGFAPFYNTQPYRYPSFSYPIPRFTSQYDSPFATVFEVNKCACNLLFPFVTNASQAGGNAYDTGIAIANTSLDPGANFGFSATPQQGFVQFWYYGLPASIPTQISGIVPPGQVLTYVLSTGAGSIGADPNGPNGTSMLPSAAGFQGYIIAQAQFQYCHAYAFINAAGSLATSPGVSEGYLGIVLDNPWQALSNYLGVPLNLTRTSQLGENDAH